MKHFFHYSSSSLLLIATSILFRFGYTDAFAISSTYNICPKQKRLHNNVVWRTSTSSTTLRTTTTTSTTISSSQNENNNDMDSYTPITSIRKNDGIYRPFLNYAWEKLSSSNLISDDTSSTDKIYNSSPSKGSPDGTLVNVEIQSINGLDNGSLRLARYALLETMTPGEESNMISLNQGIHVLNLVLFPNVNDQCTLSLPILGMDLVTLPGGKHLIAIDFQPILPIENDHSEQTIYPTLIINTVIFNNKYQLYPNSSRTNAVP